MYVSQPILAAVNFVSETIIKTDDLHCLLPGDTVSLNGVTSQVFQASPNSFTVSGEVHGVAGDTYQVLDLCPTVDDEKRDESDEPLNSYNWDTELIWLKKYFTFQEKRKRLTFQRHRGDDKRAMAAIIASIIDSI